MQLDLMTKFWKLIQEIYVFMVHKPLAGFMMLIVAIIFGFIHAGEKYEDGKAEGAEASKEEIKSLKNTIVNDTVEIHTLKGRVAYYKKLNDACNERGAKSFNIQFEEKLNEMDRLNRIMERRIQTREILNENNKNLLPK